jgi:hypothetical protein
LNKVKEGKNKWQTPLKNNFVSGSEILTAITPSIIKTTEVALSRFGPADRDCYVDEEFPLTNLYYDGIDAHRVQGDPPQKY